VAIPETEVGTNTSPAWHALVRYRSTILQLSLSAVVVYLYGIEDPSLLTVMVLAIVGFAVSVVLPRPRRIAFFVCLSFVGALITLGIRDGTCLLALGLTLIGICRLPVPMRYRVAILIVVGGVLTVLRTRWSDAPWSSAVWPVLGSMFMFRIVLYLRALSADKSVHRLQDAFAYFFMFPNLAFPLFPVVDYQTMRRTYFDRDDREIYEQGLVWISRGIGQLILYRFVYQNLLGDPVDVAGLGDLVQSMLATFLLYIRVSGQFHLVVGLLHLFGFRLPETHKLYYLATGFTDLWRRINIYWTDFMTKVVFYPTYFKLKRLGPVAALSLATAAVFLTTLILHAYQWFWLQGEFNVRFQDVLFWGILGVLVIRGARRELRTEKSPRQLGGPWKWKNGFKAAATFTVFCILWSLWSSNTVAGWVWNLGAAANVDLKGIVLLAAVLGTVFFLAAYDWRSAPPSGPEWLQFLRKPGPRSTLALIVLLIMAQPAWRDFLPAGLAARLNSLQSAKLNSIDADLQVRGYYEQLNIHQAPNAPPLAVWETQFNDCISERWRERPDYLLHDFTPSLHIRQKCFTPAQTFSTNTWGLRDKEYSLAKPDGTLRIEIFGPSHVAGWGVSDGEPFEQLVEDRLNREFSCGRYRHFEILNFAVDSYSPLQELGLLEERGFRFSPDIVIFSVYKSTKLLALENLVGIAKRRVTVPYQPVRTLLADAGLENIDRGTVSVPFESWRRFAKLLGLQPKVPRGELNARAYRIADAVNEWVFARFAAVAAQHRVSALVLATTNVFDDIPAEVEYLPAIEAAGLPVINLYRVYPESQLAALRVSGFDPHPNAAGHRVIADHLYGELAPLIKSKCQD
jgi:hypothetical protein